MFRNTVLPIIEGRTLVSLRDLEQLVTRSQPAFRSLQTRHSAANPIEYFVDGKYVRVFEQYKSCVKANEKKNCDQFRRHNRVFVDCGIERSIETTIGQMNFMLFAIQNGVITYNF